MSDQQQNGEVIQLPISQLIVSKLNVRKKSGDIETLKSSIESVGILQPLLVRPEGSKTYGIIVGSRRYEAAKQVGLKQVPCIIKKMNDAEALVESVSENVQRNDLSIEEILATYFELQKLDTDNWNVSKFAKKVGMTPEWIGEILLAYKCLTKLRQSGMRDVTMDSRPSEEERAKGVLPIKHLREIERIVNSEPMKAVFTEIELDKKRLELAEVIRDVNFNQKHLLRLMEVIRTDPRRPIPDIKEEVKSESTKELLKNYLPRSVVNEIKNVAKETNKPIFDVVPEIIKKGLQIEATKEQLLNDPEFLREAVKKYVSASASEPKPKKTREDMVLEEDRDAAIQTYHDIFQLLTVLRQHLKLDTTPQNIRQKGWVNIVKHLSKDEASKLVYEYIEEINKELMMIKGIAQTELKQRGKELA